MSDPAQSGDPVRLSIIIVNWNTRGLLETCLDSLGPYIADPRCEIIVVDNASTDTSPAMVASQFPHVRLITLPENVGFSRGNNAGIEQSSGQYILLLNSDTEVHSDGLWRMCDYMDQHPRVGALGAKLVSPDGSIQPSYRSFPSFQTALFNRTSLLTRLFPKNRWSRAYLMSDTSHTETREVDWVMGAALMTRREVIDGVGMLDGEFFMYAEDVDWCYRMRQAGWTIVFFPVAEVMHHYEKSASRAPFRMNRARHQSMWRFYKKHYSQGRVWLDMLTFTAIGVRCLVMALRDTFRLFLAKITRPS